MQAIRAEDHAMLQPMFQAKLVRRTASGPRCRRSRSAPRYTAPPGRRSARARSRAAIVATSAPILATRDLGLDIGGAHDRRRCLARGPRGRARSASSARTAPARRRSSTCSPGLIRPTAAASCSTARTSRDAPPYRRARRGLGRTFQVSSVFPLLSVRENVRLAGEAALGGTLRLWRRAAAVRPRSSGRRGRSTGSGSAAARRGPPGCSRTATSASSSSRCCSPATRA